MLSASKNYVPDEVLANMINEVLDEIESDTIERAKKNAFDRKQATTERLFRIHNKI